MREGAGSARTGAIEVVSAARGRAVAVREGAGSARTGAMLY